MAYGVKYRFDFYSKINNHLNRIDISEDGYGGSVNILPEMGATPIVIKWIDSDFEKKVPIIASEATLEFVQSATFDIDTFFSNSDMKFKVQHYINSRLNWTGFVQTDDLQQPYQDPPNYFTVKAIDGLAFLKTKDLVDIDGEKIYTKERIIDFVFGALKLSGNELNINNWVSVFPYSEYGSGSLWDRGFNPNYDPFNLTFIYGQSFMTGKAEFDNCYNVLTRIVKSFDAKLYQWDGEWHIVRNEDYIYYNGLLSSSKYEFGTEFPISSDINHDFSIAIGRDAEVKQVQRSVNEGRRRPVKYTRLEHFFQQWPQLVINDRFTEGDPVIPQPGAYTLDGWTITNAPVYGIIETGTFGNLEQSYIQMEHNSDGGIIANMRRAQSSGIPVVAKDKIQVSFRTRETTSNTATGQGVTILRLTDGANTYMCNNAGQWGPAGVTRTFGYTWGSSQDRRNWVDYSVETGAFPVSGTLYLEFYSAQHPTSANNVRFKDLQLIMINYVYDSVVASGQYDKLTQNETIISDFEDDLPLCNVVTPTDQGALFAGTDLPLAENFFHYGVDEQIPFMRIINKGVFRSLYRTYKKYDGQFTGIMWNDGGTDKPIGLINLFYWDGEDERLMCTGIEIDYKRELANITMIELFTNNGTDDTKEPDTATFRFIDEQDLTVQPVYEKRKKFWQKVEDFLGKGTISRVISIFKK